MCRVRQWFSRRDFHNRQHDRRRHCNHLRRRAEWPILWRGCRIHWRHLLEHRHFQRPTDAAARRIRQQLGTSRLSKHLTDARSSTYDTPIRTSRRRNGYDARTSNNLLGPSAQAKAAPALLPFDLPARIPMAPARFGRKRPAAVHSGPGITQIPKVANRPARPIKRPVGAAVVLHFPVRSTPPRPETAPRSIWQILHAALNRLEQAHANAKARRLETALRRAKEPARQTHPYPWP